MDRKYVFEYQAGRTVTVRAVNIRHARYKAREKLNARYEKAGKADMAPVGWSLRLKPEYVPQAKTIQSVVDYLEGVLGLRVYGPGRTFGDPPIEYMGCMDYDADAVLALRRIGEHNFIKERP